MCNKTLLKVLYYAPFLPKCKKKNYHFVFAYKLIMYKFFFIIIIFI